MAAKKKAAAKAATPQSTAAEQTPESTEAGAAPTDAEVGDLDPNAAPEIEEGQTETPEAVEAERELSDLEQEAKVVEAKLAEARKRQKAANDEVQALEQRSNQIGRALSTGGVDQSAAYKRHIEAKYARKLRTMSDPAQAIASAIGRTPSSPANTPGASKRRTPETAPAE